MTVGRVAARRTSRRSCPRPAGIQGRDRGRAAKGELQRRYPNASLLGEKTGQDLTSHMAAADVFVFPSLTDTFGVVQLAALACGTPVRRLPGHGPLDVIADHPIGGTGAPICEPRACARSTCPGKPARLALNQNLSEILVHRQPERRCSLACRCVGHAS